MSAIAGIFQWDGRPVDEHAWTALTEACRPGGPEGGGTVHVQPGLALQAHVAQVDATAVVEAQPYRFGRGSVLTWDGRLDNRDDLLLALHSHVVGSTTDAALVAAGYQRWGLDKLLLRLVGDWSFALWDADQHRLVLARDYMGCRRLYYRETPHGLIWATSLAALTTQSPDCPPPSTTYVAGVLTLGLPPALTAFEGVWLLRAGHVLIAQAASRVTLRRYWTFSPATIRYRDATQYTEHLRALLTEAVRVRLRSHRRVWAHLSGGWDSSTVVCLAHRLIESGLVAAPAVQPLSVVSSNSPESDERAFIGAVEAWCGLRSLRIEHPGYPTFAELVARATPEEWCPFEQAVHDAGDRVVLTGVIGDNIMLRADSRTALLEPLLSGRPWATLQLCAARARAKHRPLVTTLAQLVHQAYMPPALARARTARRHQRERIRVAGVARTDPAGAYGVTPDLWAQVRRFDVDHPSAEGFPRVKRKLVASLYRLADKGNRAPLPLDLVISRTDPYTHRPLVEFMLAAPTLAFWNPLGGTRTGMQQAFADILPPTILNRPTKGNPTAVLTRARRDWGATLVDEGLTAASAPTWEVVRRGYIDGRILARDLHHWQNAVDPSQPHSLNLVHCVHLEAWLRSLRTIAAARVRPAADAPMPVGGAR